MRIHQTLRALCVLALPLLGAGACKDFLTGEGLTTDPNAPTNATADQLFIGAEVATMGLFEGSTATLASLVYTQQLSGVARQWINIAQYSNNEYTAEGGFIRVYGGGGLVDLRKVQDLAKASSNFKLQGMAQVLEALDIGQEAEWFGDIPYSEALKSATPKLDPQAQVYAQLQTLLDDAITNLNKGGNGTGAVDFFYGNDAAKWTALAHTLKARFYVHVSRLDNSAFAKALGEARQGIKSPAGNLTTVHSSSVGERNLFYEFSITRAGDIEPGRTLVDLLNQGNETALLNDYFIPNPQGKFVGSPPDVSTPSASQFNLPPDRSTVIVSYAENQMIIAEAQYRTGDQAGALATLNAFRASRGAPALSNLSGPNLLVAILREKYINSFMSAEVYSDYRRTCYPNVPLATRAKQNFIPGRFFYSGTERIANPNIPSIEAQTANPSTPNYPKNATDPLGNPCLGQKDRPGK